MARFPCFFAFGLITLLSATAAVSEEATVKYPDCYCTDRTGQRVELGVSICMVVDGRDFWARCEMSLNNPTWREIEAGCLNADVEIDQITLDDRIGNST